MAFLENPEAIRARIQELQTRTNLSEEYGPQAARQVALAKRQVVTTTEAAVKAAAEQRGYTIASANISNRSGQTKVKGAASSLVIDAATAVTWANAARLPGVLPGGNLADLATIKRRILKVGEVKSRIDVKGRKMVNEDLAWAALKGVVQTQRGLAEYLSDGYAATAGPIIQAALESSFGNGASFKITQSGKIYASIRRDKRGGGGKTNTFAPVSMRSILKNVPRFYKTPIKKLLLYTFGQLGMQGFRMDAKSVNAAIATAIVNWNKAGARAADPTQAAQMVENKAGSINSFKTSQANALTKFKNKLDAAGTQTWAQYANLQV